MPLQKKRKIQKRNCDAEIIFIRKCKRNKCLFKIIEHEMRMKMNGKNKVPIFINYERNNCKLEKKDEKHILSKFLSDYKFMSSFIRSLYD